MPKVRIGSFNCENLFARYRFRSKKDPSTLSKNGFTINDLKYFDFLKNDEKRITARAIEGLDADVIAVQEIENFDVLKHFRSEWLKKMRYTHALLVDGNDPRYIDVAVLSRYPIIRARSYQHLRSGTSAIFSRDCLELDIAVGSKTVALYVNHFKSMLDKTDAANGRKNTRARRGGGRGPRCRRFGSPAQGFPASGARSPATPANGAGIRPAVTPRASQRR